MQYCANRMSAMPVRIFVRKPVEFSLNPFATSHVLKKLPFFWWRRAPQQMLRTHRSLKASCATLWWRWGRWFVFFFIFPSNEHRWNEIDRVKLKYWGKKPVPVPLCPPQIPQGLTRVKILPLVSPNNTFNNCFFNFTYQLRCLAVGMAHSGLLTKHLCGYTGWPI